MAVDLTAITAEVANNSSVTGSVLTLVQNLVAQIAAIPPSTDPVLRLRWMRSPQPCQGTTVPLPQR